MTYGFNIHLKVPAPAGIGRRNPGRMDGVKWNGSTFICVPKVDGFDQGSSDEGEDDYVDDYDFAPSHQNRPLTVSILDIAQPAKPKGKFIFRNNRLNTERHSS
jgi:hypothetical protein